MFMNGRRAYYALNRQRSNAVRRLHRYGSAQRKASLRSGGVQWSYEHAIVKQAVAFDRAASRKNTVVTSYRYNGMKSISFFCPAQASQAGREPRPTVGH